MRRSTRVSLDQVLTTWQALLAEQPNQALDYAHELFQVGDVISEQAALSRALIDPARQGQERSELANRVFADRAASPVVDFLAGLVHGKIASPADLCMALEYSGVETILIHAQQQGVLDKVEEELYRVTDVLSENTRLRAILGDGAIATDGRIELAKKLFDGVTEQTWALLEHGLNITQNHNLVALLREWIMRSAERAEHLAAIVSVAHPLKPEQEERLTKVLQKKYDRPVELHVGIDPKVIGGMRIRVGSDVIDGTLATRINHLKSAL